MKAICKWNKLDQAMPYSSMICSKNSIVDEDSCMFILFHYFSGHFVTTAQLIYIAWLLRQNDYNVLQWYVNIVKLRRGLGKDRQGMAVKASKLKPEPRAYIKFGCHPPTQSLFLLN